MKPNDLLIHIKDALIGREQSLAVAESVTTGLLQVAFGGTIEASRFYQGGITAYNIGQKCRHLDVDPVHSLGCDCVSKKVAQDMALGVCKLFTSSWGIGITGYATAVPESNNALYACYCIAFEGTILHAERIEAQQADPAEVRLFYVDTIIEKLAYLLTPADKDNKDFEESSALTTEMLGHS